MKNRAGCDIKFLNMLRIHKKVFIGRFAWATVLSCDYCAIAYIVRMYCLHNNKRVGICRNPAYTAEAFIIWNWAWFHLNLTGKTIDPDWCPDKLFWLATGLFWSLNGACLWLRRCTSDFCSTFHWAIWCKSESVQYLLFVSSIQTRCS